MQTCSCTVPFNSTEQSHGSLEFWNDEFSPKTRMINNILINNWKVLQGLLRFCQGTGQFNPCRAECISGYWQIFSWIFDTGATQVDHIPLVKDVEPFILHSQYHGYWWPLDAANQSTSCYEFDKPFWNIPVAPLAGITPCWKLGQFATADTGENGLGLVNSCVYYVRLTREIYRVLPYSVDSQSP